MAILRLTACFAAVLGLALGCAPGDEGLPESMIGIWRTSAASHADRYLELQPGFVTFATGKYTMDVRAIESVHSEPATAPQRGRIYTLAYRTGEGELSELRLIHDPGPPKHIRFANRKEIWTPEKATAPTPKEKRS